MVSDQPVDLPGLERRRAELYQELSQVGDFRRGWLNEVRSGGDRPGCACAQMGYPGHGPKYSLTRYEGGMTMTWPLQPGPEVDKVRREIGEYERFRDLVKQVSEVNEAICAARPVPAGGVGDDGLLPTGEEEDDMHAAGPVAD